MLTSFEEARMLLKGRDMEMRERWEIARWMMFTVVSGNPYIRQGHRPRRPSDLLRFPWENADERHVAEPLSKEQAANLANIRAMYYKNIRN